MSRLHASEALALAERCAAEAGAILVGRFGRPAEGASTKSSATDPVSDADRAAEAAIVRGLRAARPADRIIAEEGSGGGDGSSGIRWFVDPLDGTANYLYGIPHWSVVIACADADGALAGVVFDPLKGELFLGCRGGGAWLRGPGSGPDRRLAVNAVSDLALALASTGFSYQADERARQAAILATVLPRVRDVRRHGSAALDLAWVAAGRHDLYFESVSHPWDWVAGALLVTEAGGRVSELAAASGGEPRIVASGAALHESLLALLRAAVQTGAESLNLSR